jgi:hypothetical protein
MADPDPGFGVAALIAFAVNVQSGQAAGDDVFAGGGQGQVPSGTVVNLALR